MWCQNKTKPHMCRISKFPVCNQEKSEQFHFSAVKNFMVEATTDAMCHSSHGGLLVLRQEEEHQALASQLSSCIHDSRTPYLVRRSLTEILMTRIFQICLGYEDVNDCESSSTPRHTSSCTPSEKGRSREYVWRRRPYSPSGKGCCCAPYR